MNKIYISENYLIIEDSRTNFFQFSISRTTYIESSKDGIDSFILNESGNNTYYINSSDVTNGLWNDETGTIPFTITTLRTFLRTNTGNF